MVGWEYDCMGLYGMRRDAARCGAMRRDAVRCGEFSTRGAVQVHMRGSGRPAITFTYMMRVALKGGRSGRPAPYLAFVTLMFAWICACEIP